MKRINLDQGEETSLEQFVGSGANYVKVIEKIFTFYLEDLKNIQNIDPKGNMGLQTLARQEAFGNLEEIRNIIFPGLAERKKLEERPTGKMSPFR